MAWRLEDVERFNTKIVSKAEKRQWVATANAARDRCIAEGGKEEDCDAAAIRIANGAVKEAEAVGLDEAATIKAQAQGLLRAAKALLGNKALPESLHQHIDSLRTALKKAWADLEGEDGEGADPAMAAAEAATQPTAEVILTEALDTELLTECIPLAEKAIRADGTVPIKIIAPGRGSSGFYPAEVLRRDGPKVFTAGTKMFWDHPSATEEQQRPERSLRDFAAELVTDAAYRDGPAGEGLYADAKVFEQFRASVNELAPHIGVSIRALGKARMGEVGGEKGPVIEQIVAARSVDFVTTPGAGGKVLSLFEAARQPSIGGVTVSEEEAKKMAEENAALKAEIVALKAKISELEGETAKSEAKAAVGEALRKAELPEAARDRVAKMLAAIVPMKEGKLDSEVLAQQIAEAVKAESEYVAAIRPVAMSATVVTGLGATSIQPAGAALKESFKQMFVKLGKTAEEAERLATTAAQGR